jgi:V/A-type H+-transporting ATPase subunit D
MSYPTTRSAALELKREISVIEEGKGFLDKKQQLLARELLAEISNYEGSYARHIVLQRKLQLEFLELVRNYGVDLLDLCVEPEDQKVAYNQRAVFGVNLYALKNLAFVENVSDGVSYPLENYVSLGREYLHIAAGLAAMEGNILRLRNEYLKTAQRTRALENVVLPELQTRSSAIDSALEEVEREDSILFRRAR